MHTEIFYRMPAWALEHAVEGFGTVADAIARWHADPWYDGPDIAGLLDEVGAVQTYYGALGGIDPGVLGFPPRLEERIAAVRRGFGPWPTHEDEPDPFHDVMGVVWVAPEELVEVHTRMTVMAAQRFADTGEYGENPDVWLQELERWLDPVSDGDIEVWLFQVVEPDHGERGVPYVAGRGSRRSRGWAALPWVLLVLWLAILGLVVFAP
jgi:hypothetical protein